MLSVLRVPKITIVSPLALTTSRIKRLEGSIFNRPVHQRNLLRGAG